MFESVKQYLQDWSDACEYAAECWPDTPFLHLNQIHIGEPYTALATIFGVCLLIWARNERILAKLRVRGTAAVPAASEPSTMRVQMEATSQVNKLAA